MPCHHHRSLIKSIGTIESITEIPQPPGRKSFRFRVQGNDFVGHRSGHIVREIITLETTLWDPSPPVGGVPLDLWDQGMTHLLVEISDVPKHLVLPNGWLLYGRRFHLSLRWLLEMAFDEDMAGDIQFTQDDGIAPHASVPGRWVIDTWVNSAFTFTPLYDALD